VTVKFQSPEEEEAQNEVASPSTDDGQADATRSSDSEEGRLRHSHDPEDRYNHSHPDGDRPHRGHAEDGSPIFEVPDPSPDDESGCPGEPHLHITRNRAFGFPFGLMDIGHQIVTGKDPWTFSSHCPKCGELVQDRNSRRFQCTNEGCDGSWEVPRAHFGAAREAARHSPLGEELTMLTPEG